MGIDRIQRKVGNSLVEFLVRNGDSFLLKYGTEIFDHKTDAWPWRNISFGSSFPDSSQKLQNLHVCGIIALNETSKKKKKKKKKKKGRTVKFVAVLR